MNRVGVQLYTVRSQLSDDAERVFANLKEKGCDTVQFFGGVDMLEQYGPICTRYGLSIVGILGDLETFVNEQERLFDLCRSYGIEDIGISSDVISYDEAVFYIPKVNRFAAAVKAAGFSFSYHNHSNEFVRTSCGKTVMDLFLDGFDPELVCFMPDTYWLQHGGCDVRHFLETVKGRVKILHLKDMKRTNAGPTFAEVGYGNLYFEGILRTALSSGIKTFIIEQDECDGDSIESVEKSLTYLKGLNLL